MKARWIGTGATAVLVTVAVLTDCGEGRAIFDVDVYRFLKSGADTVHYTIPIVGTASDSNPPIKVGLLGGFGKSVVDTVTITGGANLVNTTGSGNVTFRLFIAADSAGTYSGTPVLTASGAVNGPGTTAIGAAATLIGDSLFNNQTLWFGVQARVTATTPPVTGKVQVTVLRLRVVMKPKLL
ncbi:MAG: hypothetical protein DMD41_03495 [Gemmatimonadetes bacterium]|nr:MAG: hypothetical protein DMD41_03495 [Gemmatimonadota bacterium]